MIPTPDTSTARSVAHVASGGRQRVLMMSDNEPTQRAIAEYLEREGYEVRSIAHTSSLASAHTFAPALVIIDVRQPETVGLQAVRRVRELINVPILILGPRIHSIDRLIDGAEYLSKPFQEADLLRRIQALLGESAATVESVDRATGVLPLEGDLRFDDLVIRPRLRVVERDGVPIELSATEFELLYFLASHPRQVFTRQQLLDRVWHYQYLGDSNTVTVHMSRLRKKVEPDPSNPRHLRTVWSVGYKFVP